MTWLDPLGHSFSSAQEVLWLFLIPVGGGIPSGVLAAKERGMGWLWMAVLYLISDVILAVVFEGLMLGLIAATRRQPRLVRLVEALKQPAARASHRFGSQLGPLALVMLSFGVDPMTGRAAAKAMGHGFLSGWAIAITGDLLFFGVIAYSTLMLNTVLNETWTTLIILAAMFVVPGLCRRVKALGSRRSAA